MLTKSCLIRLDVLFNSPWTIGKLSLTNQSVHQGEFSCFSIYAGFTPRSLPPSNLMGYHSALKVKLPYSMLWLKFHS